MSIILAIKIILICLGCVYFTRSIMTVYSMTMQVIGSIAWRKDFKFSFSNGWLSVTGLSLAAIIIGIIL